MSLSVDLLGTEWTGSMKVRHFDVTITDYDSTGESFPLFDVGMNRIQNIIITPAGGDVYSTGFDFEQNLLFTDLTDGEDATMKVTVMGR